MIIHEKIKAKYPNYKYDSTKKCKLNTLAKKYEISRSGTIANWKRKYLNGTLNQDNRGKRLKPIEDIDILKKSYALLMEIRSQQHK